MDWCQRDCARGHRTRRLLICALEFDLRAVEFWNCMFRLCSPHRTPAPDTGMEEVLRLTTQTPPAPVGTVTVYVLEYDNGKGEHNCLIS